MVEDVHELFFPTQLVQWLRYNASVDSLSNPEIFAGDSTHNSQQFPVAMKFLTLKLPRLHNPRELHIQHMSLPSPEGGQPDMFDRLS